MPFGFYAPRGTDSERAGGGSGTTAAPGTEYQDTGGGGHHTDGVLYLGSRGSLADTLPLHITPRWLSAHSGKASHNVTYRPTYINIPSDPVSNKAYLCNVYKLCNVSMFIVSRNVNM